MNSRALAKLQIESTLSALDLQIRREERLLGKVQIQEQKLWAKLEDNSVTVNGLTALQGAQFALDQHDSAHAVVRVADEQKQLFVVSQENIRRHNRLIEWLEHVFLQLLESLPFLARLRGLFAAKPACSIEPPPLEQRPAIQPNSPNL
jgi:hypothetical protein